MVKITEMTKRQFHIQQHKNWNRSLDQLVRDFVKHTERLLGETTVLELMKWSQTQLIAPTEEE